MTGHIDDFAHWVADLAALWGDWRADRGGRLVLAGHSMGGHLALRAVAEGAARPDALVLSAPMLGFLPDFLPPAVQHAAAGLMCRIGDPRRPAWKWSEKPGELPASRATLLTHDATRYADEQWWRDQRPELKMGPGSWGWTSAACESLRKLARPGVLEQVEVPTLLLAAEHDRLVSSAAIRRAAARMPDAELVTFGSEAYHELLREADPVRDRALAAIDRFLDRIVPR